VRKQRRDVAQLVGLQAVDDEYCLRKQSAKLSCNAVRCAGTSSVGRAALSSGAVLAGCCTNCPAHSAGET
jgi:hypothetical protein